MDKPKRYEFEPVDMNKYRGEWIAFIDGKIVVHGQDYKEVVNKAKKLDPDPIFEKVPEQDILVL